jgi:hypothetical protein
MNTRNRNGNGNGSLRQNSNTHSCPTDAQTRPAEDKYCTLEAVNSDACSPLRTAYPRALYKQYNTTLLHQLQYSRGASTSQNKNTHSANISLLGLRRLSNALRWVACPQLALRYHCLWSQHSARRNNRVGAYCAASTNHGALTDQYITGDGA